MTRRVFRAVPAAAAGGSFNLTIQSPATPAAGAATAAVTLSVVASFSWPVGVAIADTLPITGGSGTYSSAVVSSGALPAGVTLLIVGTSVTFVGSPSAAGTGTATITVTDSGSLTGTISIGWLTTAAVASYASLPDGAITSNDAGMTYAAGVFTSGAPYSRALVNAKTSPGAGTFFTIDLPAGTYTGNVRLTVLTNTTSSPYDHHLFLESSDPEYSGNPVAIAVYNYDIGSTTAADTIYCPAGVDDGGGGSGGCTFSLEFEGALD